MSRKFPPILASRFIKKVRCYTIQAACDSVREKGDCSGMPCSKCQLDCGSLSEEDIAKVYNELVYKVIRYKYRNKKNKEDKG